MYPGIGKHTVFKREIISNFHSSDCQTELCTRSRTFCANKSARCARTFLLRENRFSVIWSKNPRAEVYHGAVGNAPRERPRQTAMRRKNAPDGVVGVAYAHANAHVAGAVQSLQSKRTFAPLTYPIITVAVHAAVNPVVHTSICFIDWLGRVRRRTPDLCRNSVSRSVNANGEFALPLRSAHRDQSTIAVGCISNMNPNEHRYSIFLFCPLTLISWL